MSFKSNLKTGIIIMVSAPVVLLTGFGLAAKIHKLSPSQLCQELSSNAISEFYYKIPLKDFSTGMKKETVSRILQLSEYQIERYGKIIHTLPHFDKNSEKALYWTNSPDSLRSSVLTDCQPD